ncbi:MAG: helix-turn-helix domain-containing protein [Clostridia bacterium]|nr:helix-turn-helix domain-containing protein [Clostridia bacterium]
MITHDQIKQRIIEEIKNCGMKQEELAKAINVGQSSISQYIKGTKMPSVETIANLCVVLDLNANELLCIKDEKGTK